MAARFTTDSLTPSSLPSATLGRRRPNSNLNPGSTSFDNPGESSTSSKSKTDAELDKVRDEWNLKIDKEIKGVVGGLRELVEMADITPKPQSSSTTLLPLHLKIKTSTLIRSAQNIRNLAHQLKLLLILSDEVEIARKRDVEAGLTRRDVLAMRREVVEALRKTLGAEDGVEEDQEEGLKREEDTDVEKGKDEGMEVVEEIEGREEVKVEAPKPATIAAPNPGSSLVQPPSQGIGLNLGHLDSDSDDSDDFEHVG